MASMLPQSLLDRLIDDAPDEAAERSDSDEQALERFKLGLRRDLEALLNSKRPLLGAVESGSDLERTILGFGLTDISTEDFSAAGVRDRIRRMVAQCIRDHEPRLSRVEVETEDGPRPAASAFVSRPVLTLPRLRRQSLMTPASVPATGRSPST
jgi:type VI secretion system protein ImpF